VNSQNYVHRKYHAEIMKQFQQYKCVLLLGPRQVGKTSLANNLVKDGDFVYLNLESPDDFKLLGDPSAFLAENPGKRIIFDESQFAPELFPALKVWIDQNEHTGNTGRYLILGSAAKDLETLCNEHLGVRKKTIELSPFDFIEMIEFNGKREGPSIQLHDIEAVAQMPRIEKPFEIVEQLWHRGGFPESLLADTVVLGFDWLVEYVRSTLERDMPKYDISYGNSKLRSFWEMIASLQGEPFNIHTYTKELQIGLPVPISPVTMLVDYVI
jgi:uncharacterized protein